VAAAHSGRVERDVESAAASGATGTPTFFINGERFFGAYDASSLVEALEGCGLVLACTSRDRDHYYRVLDVREGAARAVAAAMPFLARAKEVVVMTASRRDRPRPTARASARVATSCAAAAARSG